MERGEGLGAFYGADPHRIQESSPDFARYLEKRHQEKQATKNSTAPTKETVINNQITQAEIENAVPQHLWPNSRVIPEFRADIINRNPDNSIYAQVLINPGNEYGQQLRHIIARQTANGLYIKEIAKPTRYN
jgi:hypothetical protein